LLIRATEQLEGVGESRKGFSFSADNQPPTAQWNGDVAGWDFFKAVSLTVLVL
jgi:hypothetical protein